MTQHPNTDHIDSLLQPWRALIGKDYDGYRNHVVRMAAFCLRLKACTAEEQRKIEIAACFHDIGIWTENTLDYLPPSVTPALQYLSEHGLDDWAEEIREMILQHHKVKAVNNGVSDLVELFRKGDLVDFSRGIVRFGLSRRTVDEVMRQYPNAGFHGMLVRRSLPWLLKHPLNPLPMMKW